MKSMQRQYSGYHFKNECKHRSREINESKHSYMDYSDVFNDNSKDKHDDDDNKAD